MSDLLSTSVSGLLAFQRALDVTSNNVANAATPGYSVQSVDLTERPSQASAAGFFGGGVDVATVQRTYDQALAQQVRSSQSAYSSFNAFATQAAQVDNMLSDSNTGLTASLQAFVNALQNVADSPSSSGSRQVLLGQAQALTQQLRSYDSQLTQYDGNIESQISSNLSQINSIAGNIATLNRQIASALGATGQPPNDLLDKRDALIDELSKYVSVSTSTQSDGQVNVYIGSGQTLVTGGSAQALTTVPSLYDPTRTDVAISMGGTSTADITSQITGGTLGGLISVRSQVIDSTRNALGQLAVGLATIVNQQQAVGMDLTGSLGQPMFTVGGVQTLAASTNTGSASLSVARGSLASLTTDDYRMQFAGGAWQLTDVTTGQAVSMTGSGTGTSPFQAAGLSIVVTGSPANGDSFEIRPTAAATHGLAVTLTNPAQIAAASPIQASAGASNTGTGAIASEAVMNPADPQLLTTATIQFTSPSTYTINGSGSFSYSSGQPILANGWSVTLTGSPATGDTFTVASNAGGIGDNRNAFATIAALTSSSSLDGGTTSLSGAANSLVSGMGVITQQAQSNSSAQQVVNQDAVTARNNVSGVNLDEEAANMVRYQQMYQAMAQMISASDTMFKSLVAAIASG